MTSFAPFFDPGVSAAVDNLPISSASDLPGISVDSLLNSVDLASIVVPSTVGQAPRVLQASEAQLISPGPSAGARAPASDQIAVSSPLQPSGAPASDLAPATQKMPVSVDGAAVGSIVNQQPAKGIHAQLSNAVCTQPSLLQAFNSVSAQPH